MLYLDRTFTRPNQNKFLLIAIFEEKNNNFYYFVIFNQKTLVQSRAELEKLISV